MHFACIFPLLMSWNPTANAEMAERRGTENDPSRPKCREMAHHLTSCWNVIPQRARDVGDQMVIKFSLPLEARSK